jgi:hypothetical protein
MSDKLTPVQRLAEADKQVETLTSQLGEAKLALESLANSGGWIPRHASPSVVPAQLEKAIAEHTFEASAHAETKVKLSNAEADLKTTKALLDAQAASFEAELVKRVSIESAKIVASQGLPDSLKTKVEDDHVTVGKPEAGSKTGLARFAEVAYAEAWPLYARAHGIKIANKE